MKKNIKTAVQNLKSNITLIVMIMFCMSCQETMITKEFTSDLELIVAIQNVENKVIISMNSLPEVSKIAINTTYSGNYISKSELAPELGYQVDLRKHKGRQVANKSVAYFDIDGRMLIADEDFKAKKGGRGGKKGMGNRGALEDCFDFVYPFTLLMPDVLEIEIADIEGWDLVKAWYEVNPEEEERPIFVFPLNILVEESEMTINDEDEFKAIAEGCKNSKDGKRVDCFEVVYPFTLTMPDSALITLESDDDRAFVKAWHDAHPEVKEKGIFVFPISLEYPDGAKVEIDTKEDFEEIKKDC